MTTGKQHDALDWADARDLFPVTENYAYFQSAAVTALPTPAREAIAEITREMAEDGVLNESRWIRRIESIRTRAARLIQSPPDRLGFVKNTSHGLTILAHSLPLDSGDAIAVPTGEFPANVYPWMSRCERDDLEFQPIPRGEDGGVYLEQIDRTVDDQTRVLAVSSVQFHNGFRTDLEALGDYCRDQDIWLIVDGIQSIGWDPLDVHDLPIDALVADGHKWMCGPEGVGLLYLTEALQQQLSLTNVGWKSVRNPMNFSEWNFDLREGADVVEEGSPNTVGLMGLGASLKIIDRLGLPPIRDKNMDLRNTASEELRKRNFHTPSKQWHPRHQSPILTVEHPELDHSAVHEQCRERDVQLSLRDDKLRLGFHFYNNKEDLRKLLDVVDTFL